MTKQIHIFDTTLRDGQQSPGAGMSMQDNIHYAKIAKKMNVDLLEAGFPSASQYEFARVQTIIHEIVDEESPIIVGLTQTRQHLVEKTIECLLPAAKWGKGRMHIYIPVDPDLAQVSLGGKPLKDFVQQLHDFCKQATDAGLSVEFSPEGYSRMGNNFAVTTDLICAAIEGGASVINCPDTIGCAHRSQGDEYFVRQMSRHANIIQKKYPNKGIIRSMHNHNDIGTAVENSLIGVTEGPAQQIECTINGVGERAGNASMEQLVMQIYMYGEKMGITTGIQMEYLQEASDFIAQKMLARQPHWPVTGENAARHTSGGHVNALLKDPAVYQPFNPKVVGKTGISLVFGPSSGGNHAKEIIEKFGYACPKELRAGLAQFLKDMYQQRYKGVSDEEVVHGFRKFVSPIKVTDFSYSKSQGHATLELKGSCFGEENIAREVDSEDSALAILQGICTEKMPGYAVDHYQSEADTSSINAQSVATIRIRHESGTVYEGKGIDHDIEISALKALIAAYNEAWVETEYAVPDE